MSSKRSAQSNCSDNEDWRNEDPNLLNVPELLYKAAAKLPPRSANASFLEVFNMTSELMRNHNVAMETIRKLQDSFYSKEQGCAVLRKIADSLVDDAWKLNQQIKDSRAKPAWEEEELRKIFNEDSSERVRSWVLSVHQLVDSYKKIQEFIPKEIHDRTEEEAEDTKKLPEVVTELESTVMELDFLKEY